MLLNVLKVSWNEGRTNEALIRKRKGGKQKASRIPRKSLPKGPDQRRIKERTGKDKGKHV